MGLIDSLATTEALAGVFSDRSVLQAMLEFEAALARAEERCGVIPPGTAKVITSAISRPRCLARRTARDVGDPAISVAIGMAVARMTRCEG